MFELANRRIIRIQSKQHKQPTRTDSNDLACRRVCSHRERNANLWLDDGRNHRAFFCCWFLCACGFICVFTFFQRKKSCMCAAELTSNCIRMLCVFVRCDSLQFCEFFSSPNSVAHWHRFWSQSFRSLLHIFLCLCCLHLFAFLVSLYIIIWNSSFITALSFVFVRAVCSK